MADNELNLKVAEALGRESKVENELTWWSVDTEGVPSWIWEYFSPSTNVKLALECARKFFGSRNFTMELSSAGWFITHDEGRHHDIAHGPFGDEAELAHGLCEAIVAAWKKLEKTP